MRGGFRLVRTQAFRIVLIYVLLFAVSVTALLGFTYWITSRTVNGQADEIIQAEITGLSEQYQRLGWQGLYQSVNERSQQRGSQALYLLTDGEHRRLVGNLTFWPAARADAGNYVEFDYERRVNNGYETRHARGQILRLEGDNFYLLVAEDIQDRYVTQSLFTTTLPWTVGLILLLGLVGGLLMSLNMLRRLDAINRTSGEIIAGDLTRRVPVTGSADEFDVLAENLNRMLDRIERLMKGLREVTDSVAHDLRTPLNRLRNRLEESLARLAAQGGNVGEIERAIVETDKLIATFNALLLIAETDAGASRSQMSLLELNEVAGDVAELYEPLAEEKGIALKLERGGEAQIEGNRSLVAQALANLVDNGIKYTPPGGKVTIKVTQGADGVALTVADTGPGIPAEDRPRVVERFVRLEASRNSPGTGLGLSLVAAVAHFHGTQLLLEDNHPGLKASLVFPRAGKVMPIRPVMTVTKSAAE
ncbi:MAG: HAMP domain-containing protein [Alphaproteobacteria bacterium]|nr:HAMP domain-containing protein [Alphaproteobacteria bacterium]